MDRLIRARMPLKELFLSSGLLCSLSWVQSEYASHGPHQFLAESLAFILRKIAPAALPSVLQRVGEVLNESYSAQVGRAWDKGMGGWWGEAGHCPAALSTAVLASVTDEASTIWNLAFP
jgi:hypothetical protein